MPQPKSQNGLYPRSLSARRIRRKRIFRTPQNASPKIPLLIFELPRVRSVKIIGTSTIRKPSFHAEYFISIWNPYPRIRIRSKSIARSTSARKQTNPAVQSRTGIPNTRRT